MAETETTETETVEEETTETTTETGGGSESEDWKSHARKHERESKKARKEAEELRAKLAERENQDKTDQEKAIDAARSEASAAARAEVEAERRHDRLEVAVAKQAAKSFADLDDALIHLERAMKTGDLDAEDIFDSEGKVQTGPLKKALDDLLERKPHLAAKAPGPGGNDAGQGSGSKGAEDMSVEDHFASVRRT